MSDSIRMHCNSCGRETNHAIRTSFTSRQRDFVDDDSDEYFEETTFNTMQCLGCDELSILVTAEHDAYGSAVPQYYPARISRRTPRWLESLPEPIQQTMTEVYRALQNDSPRLATIGARTAIDLLLLNTVGDARSFAQKIAQLEAQGYVGRRNREFVAAALDAGNAAAHRGVAPELADLNRVMDILESLLESVFILGDAADRLRKVTPPRPPKIRP